MSIYVPLVSALLGALIGAAASVVTVIAQAHYQNKRELVKEAIALALEDWKTRLAIVTQKGGAALPLASSRVGKGHLAVPTRFQRLAARNA